MAITFLDLEKACRRLGIVKAAISIYRTARDLVLYLDFTEEELERIARNSTSKRIARIAVLKLRGLRPEQIELELLKEVG
jgi:hypothetical protein